MMIPIQFSPSLRIAEAPFPVPAKHAASILNLMGAAWRLTGRPDFAESHWLKAAELDPERDSIQKNIKSLHPAK